MRIIKIIFFSLLAMCLIISMGLFILFQTFNSDQYLPQIIQKASLVMGRAVSVGQLGLGLSSQGITLDAGPVIIADDRDFTSQPFIKIDRVRIIPDLRALIFQRQIRIENILLVSPQIHFIRSMEGNINVRSIGPTSPSLDEQTAINAPVVPSTNAVINNEATKRLTANSITVQSITIQDAAISFIDQSAANPLDIWLTDINAGLDGLSLDSSKKSAQVSHFGLHAELSRLDLKEIPDNSFLKNFSGSVQINMSQLVMSGPGDLTAQGDLSITGGVIKGFNIIKTALGHALGVFGDIDGLLNGSLKSTLGADDTVLQKADVRFSLHDRNIYIDDSLISTNIFELTAKGLMGQGLNMDIGTVLHLNEDVSAALINSIDGLRYLCDDSKRITIEGSFKGTYPHLKYKSNKDFRKKTRKTFNAMFRQLLGA